MFQFAHHESIEDRRKESAREFEKAIQMRSSEEDEECSGGSAPAHDKGR